MPKRPEAFFDTNVLLYLLSGEAAKADRAEALLAGGGVVSVQVLNELVAVGRRKPGLGFAEPREVLAAVRALCHVESLTVDTHELAIDLAEPLKFGIHDATIAAAALRWLRRAVFRGHAVRAENRRKDDDPQSVHGVIAQLATGTSIVVPGGKSQSWWGGGYSGWGGGTGVVARAGFKISGRGIPRRGDIRLRPS